MILDIPEIRSEQEGDSEQESDSEQEGDSEQEAGSEQEATLELLAGTLELRAERVAGARWLNIRTEGASFRFSGSRAQRSIHRLRSPAPLGCRGKGGMPQRFGADSLCHSH